MSIESDHDPLGLAGVLHTIQNSVLPNHSNGVTILANEITDSGNIESAYNLSVLIFLHYSHSATMLEMATILIRTCAENSHTGATNRLGCMHANNEIPTNQQHPFDSAYAIYAARIQPHKMTRKSIERALDLKSSINKEERNRSTNGKRKRNKIRFTQDILPVTN